MKGVWYISPKIVAYSRLDKIIQWEFHKTTGELIYKSGDILILQEWHYNLDTLGLEDGTLFYLEAIIPGCDYKSSKTFKYEPKSNTAYFQIIIETRLEFSGIVYSYQSQPVLQCSKIERNSADVDAIFA